MRKHFFPVVVILMISSANALAQQASINQIGVSTTLNVGLRPESGESGFRNFKTSLRVEYAHPKFNWVSVGVEGGLHYEVGGYFVGVNTFQFVHRPVYSLYGRVDIHPIQMFWPQSPFDVYLGGGYGYYYKVYEENESLNWEYNDYSLQAGFKYWIDANWSVGLDVGIREQTHYMMGVGYRF